MFVLSKQVKLSLQDTSWVQERRWSTRTGIHLITIIPSSKTWTSPTTAALRTLRTTFSPHISYALLQRRHESTNKCATFITNVAKPHKQQMIFQKAVPSDTSLLNKPIRSHLLPNAKHNYKKPNNTNVMLSNAIIKSRSWESKLSISHSPLLMM